MKLPTLSIVDYAVLLVLLLLSAFIGIIFGFKKTTAEEYFLASGTMHVLPTALSIMVSFLSAITILGVPSEIYMSGTMFLYQAAAYCIASVITAVVFVPKFREMKFTSIYEYLEKRFDQSFMYMALVLYAPSLALSQITGLNKWLSVVSISVVCVFYSSMGGIKAIIWTDVLQALVMYTGIVIAITHGLIRVGGIESVFLIAKQGSRIEFDNMSLDPRTRHTIWSIFIGSSLNLLVLYGFNQMQVQRYMSVRSTQAAQKALLINLIGTAGFILLTGFMGLVLYAYYNTCDPFTAGRIKNIDQILPYFIMETLGDKKGVPGLFLACVFSGTLSTISSGLNSMAAIIIEDIYKGLLRQKLDKKQQGYLSQCASIFVGVIIVLLTYVISYLGPIINAGVSLTNALCGPIMGVFFLGLFVPRANRTGAIVGFFISLILQLWIFIGAQLTKHQRNNHRLPLSILNCTDIDIFSRTNRNATLTGSLVDAKSELFFGLYSVSYMWYTTIAVGTVVIIGGIV
ncbi:unnamed protein product, partial [Adineta ricciae]